MERDIAEEARKFPPEAYAYDSDVTPEGVAVMRSKAAPIMDSQEWVPDGRVGPSAA